MSYSKYSNYKDSGVEWIGKIPVHWGIRKLKFLANIQLSNVDKHTVEGEKQVFLCNYVDVYKNEKITNRLEFMLASASDEQIRKLTLLAKDVIITKDSETPDDIGVPAFVVENLFSIVCGYHLALIRPFSDYLLGEYLFRVFQSSSTRAYFSISAVGVTRFGLGKDAIFNTAITLPPIKEQQAIANFLDCETSQLDKLIAAKERLLVLLAEKRRALITQAVTRGLDPDVEMRDSGIEWLGEIPAHWQVVRLKFLSKEGFIYGANEAGLEDNPEYPRFVRITDIDQNGLLRMDTFKSLPPDVAKPYLLKQGDILLARSGATVGKTFIYSKEWGQCCFAGYLIRFRCNLSKLLPQMLFIFTQSDLYWSQIERSTIQATIQNFSAEKYADIIIPLTSLEEQHKIVAYVETETKKLDALKAATERTISLLKERRVSLIAAAVTGQIAIEETKEETNDCQTITVN